MLYHCTYKVDGTPNCSIEGCLCHPHIGAKVGPQGGTHVSFVLLSQSTTGNRVRAIDREAHDPPLIAEVIFFGNFSNGKAVWGVNCAIKVWWAEGVIDCSAASSQLSIAEPVGGNDRREKGQVCSTNISGDFCAVKLVRLSSSEISENISDNERLHTHQRGTGYDGTPSISLMNGNGPIHYCAEIEEGVCIKECIHSEGRGASRNINLGMLVAQVPNFTVVRGHWSTVCLI